MKWIVDNIRYIPDGETFNIADFKDGRIYILCHVIIFVLLHVLEKQN